jgi:hypothetical protein
MRSISGFFFCIFTPVYYTSFFLVQIIHERSVVFRRPQVL